jgi:hypothetical protein
LISVIFTFKGTLLEDDLGWKLAITLHEPFFTKDELNEAAYISINDNE